jgi:hypothetical protein
MSDADSGMDRRRVLAALAALAGLFISGRATAADSSREIEVTQSGPGSKMDIESGDPVWSDAIIKCEGDDAKISISGTNRPNGESNVEFTAYNGVLTLWLGLSPQRAREVAEDLRLAADHAEYGGVEN